MSLAKLYPFYSYMHTMTTMEHFFTKSHGTQRCSTPLRVFPTHKPNIIKRRQVTLTSLRFRCSFW